LMESSKNLMAEVNQGLYVEFCVVLVDRHAERSVLLKSIQGCYLFCSHKIHEFKVGILHLVTTQPSYTSHILVYSKQKLHGLHLHGIKYIPSIKYTSKYMFVFEFSEFGIHGIFIKYIPSKISQQNVQ
jgi:hypothetical protein